MVSMKTGLQLRGPICMQVLARVFITPLPVLRLLERLGVSRELKLLQEAVATMRDSLLGVIHVRAQSYSNRAEGLVLCEASTNSWWAWRPCSWVLRAQACGKHNKNERAGQPTHAVANRSFVCMLGREPALEDIARRSGGRLWRRARHRTQTCWACCWTRATRRGSP